MSDADEKHRHHHHRAPPPPPPPPLKCHNCGTSSTSEKWRRLDDDRVLCTACEWYQRVYDKPRPPALWKETERKCSNCGIISKPKGWRVGAHPNEGLCMPCANYYKKHNKHRPARIRAQVCDNCGRRGDDVSCGAKPDSVLCQACSSYYRRRGEDRPPVLHRGAAENPRTSQNPRTTPPTVPRVPPRPESTSLPEPAPPPLQSPLSQAQSPFHVSPAVHPPNPALGALDSDHRFLLQPSAVTEAPPARTRPHLTSLHHPRPSPPSQLDLMSPVSPLPATFAVPRAQRDLPLPFLSLHTVGTSPNTLDTTTPPATLHDTVPTPRESPVVPSLSGELMTLRRERLRSGDRQGQGDRRVGATTAEEFGRLEAERRAEYAEQRLLAVQAANGELERRADEARGQIEELTQRVRALEEELRLAKEGTARSLLRKRKDRGDTE